MTRQEKGDLLIQVTA